MERDALGCLARATTRVSTYSYSVRRGRRDSDDLCALPASSFAPPAHSSSA